MQLNRTESIHANAGGDSNKGWRNFSIGKNITNTSDWTSVFTLFVTTMPNFVSMAFHWTSVSRRSGINSESYSVKRTALGTFNGYGWISASDNNINNYGNGINQGGAIYINGNAIAIRDWAWAGTAVVVTYTVDVFCNRWDWITPTFP